MNLDRRTTLVALAAATAGCGFLEPRSTDGGEETPPPPGADPDRPVADSVPDARSFGRSATAASGLATEALGWHGHDRVRYAPENADGFEVYEPDGWLVAYDFALENRGEEPLEAVTDYEFVLRVDGEEYDHRHELGDGIALSQVNQPDDEPEIERLTWYSELEPGERRELQLVFEPARRPDAPHYLVWYHDGPIEGAEAPAYLLPPG